MEMREVSLEASANRMRFVQSHDKKLPAYYFQMIKHSKGHKGSV